MFDKSVISEADRSNEERYKAETIVSEGLLHADTNAKQSPTEFYQQH